MNSFSVRKCASRLMASTDGNIAVTFCLALVPLIGFIGSSVDYSRAASLKTALQAALDATALMVSKSAATQTAAQVQTSADAFFKALFDRPEANNTVIKATYSATDGSSVTVSGTSNLKTDFMKVLGFQNLTISSTSTVNWGNTKLRVSLALDNTGSMASSNKLSALKTAANTLIDQLKSAATNNGDVYISIIPFSKNVNVDSSNFKKDWVDFSDHGNWQGWDSLNGTCKNYDGWSEPVSADACDSKNGKWKADKEKTWNGCVTDRDQDYDVTNTAPDKKKQATLFPAEQYSECPVELMALSYDWTALKDKISSMSANGNTNQVIGLQWAFQSLTNDPFPIPSQDPKYQYTQVIILLTDGLNTENRFSTSQSAIDLRTKKVCDNIKSAGITLYTIQVNTTGDPTQPVLQSCASSSDKFFLLTSANQIVTTFSSIGTTLSQLRISK